MVPAAVAAFRRAVGRVSPPARRPSYTLAVSLPAPGAALLRVVHLRSAVCMLGRFPALAGADLDVEAGEIVLLSGANGAGKTTLLRLCAGLLPLRSGQAEVLGVDLAVDRRAIRRVARARRPRDVLLRRPDRAREHPLRDARGRPHRGRRRRRARTARRSHASRDVTHGRLSQGQRRRVVARDRARARSAAAAARRAARRSRRAGSRGARRGRARRARRGPHRAARVARARPRAAARDARGADRGRPGARRAADAAPAVPLRRRARRPARELPARRAARRGQGPAHRAPVARRAAADPPVRRRSSS